LKFLVMNTSFTILLDLYLPIVSDLMLLIRGYSMKHVYSKMKSWLQRKFDFDDFFVDLDDLNKFAI
jgi:hypothetical protein